MCLLVAPMYTRERAKKEKKKKRHYTPQKARVKNKAASSKFCSPKTKGFFFHSCLYSVLELTPTPVYGQTTTTMPDTSTPPLPGPKKTPLLFIRVPLPDLHDTVRGEPDTPVIVRQVRVEVDHHVIRLGNGERKKREQPRATKVCLFFFCMAM